MTARILWALGLAILGVIVAQLQLDRQTARDPAMAAWVLEPFRGNAQFLAVTEALNRGDRPTAVNEGRKLLLRRPVPAENLTVYAAALYRAGDTELATLAIQTAAQRGWREPLAQEARLRLALEADDLGEAGTRYIALLLNPASDNALLQSLGEQVLAEPGSEAETVLTGLVSETDRWRATFLRRGPLVMPPAAFARVAVAAIGRGVTFDCRAVSTAVRGLSGRSAEAAERLRAATNQQCANGA